MALPVLHSLSTMGPGDLLRLYLQTQRRWCQHVGDECPLEPGFAFTNPELGEVAEANAMVEAALPEGASAEETIEGVHEHFAVRRTRCACWMLSPSAGEEQTRPLAEALPRFGYEARPVGVLSLGGRPARQEESGRLTVIPARASYRHAEALFGEAAREGGLGQLAEAARLHLDDPHWEALLALEDGRAVATGGVLGVGEVGRIDLLYVSADRRGRGYGRTMFSRLMEICARSLYRQVLYAPADAGAAALAGRFGFGAVGSLARYVRRA